MTNAGYAGGIFGENDAALEFEKFNNSGTIKGNGWIGGIIGYNNGGAIKTAIIQALSQEQERVRYSC